ncbi:MAG: hypothetical protein GY870_08780 [archaeon]|nr:hypothetical protein [archaeon]
MNNSEEKKNNIFKKIGMFNELMSTAISGPNCLDNSICHADCCHIQIDVPKLLAQYYLDNFLASENDFIRGDTFSFKINVTTKNAKCVFFNKEINGCSLHSSGMKPPQCWIYPTGFNNYPSEDKKFDIDGTIMCKKASGWKVIDEEKCKNAQEILKEYIDFCEKEFQEENSDEQIINRLGNIANELILFSPKSIAGIKDSWSKFQLLSAEGISLKIKRLCEIQQKKGKNCVFLDCNNICSEIAEELSSKLKVDILKYLKENNKKENYSFYDLWG